MNIRRIAIVVTLLCGFCLSYGVAKGFYQRGQASYYHGRSDCCTRYVAAHRTLPFGTWVTVTNLNNGRSVRVKINDRGPFIRGRVIDVSGAAARVLGMRRTGVVPVTVRK